MVVFCGGKCVAFLGYAAPGQALAAAKAGPICQKAMQSGTGNYLANLILFPGADECHGGLGGAASRCRSARIYKGSQPTTATVLFAGRLEFSYLPSNTQGAIIQPIGSSGVVVLGTDTQRGFTRLDQVGASSSCTLWSGGWV